MDDLKYEKAYSKDKTFFGEKPSLLIYKHYHMFPKKLSFLDLGCGQGQDLLFMNKMGYKCLGIDSSLTAIGQIQEIIKKRKLKNIEVKHASIADFDFSKKNHGIISLRNVLQYLEKKESLKLIKKAQKYVSQDGFIIVSAFTTEDSSYSAKTTGFKSHFEKKELLKYFSKFDIVYYFEGLIQDKGHGNYPPHQHEMVMLIAQKK
jgi:cyclopropane fatty-acyl-phospholipid synthase-like methyltransferase